MNPVITFAAEQFMRRMVRLSGNKAAGFRLLCRAGGCAGATTSFAVEEASAPTDAVIELSGVRVFLDAASRAVLDGAVVDFTDSPAHSGLTASGPALGTPCASLGGPSVAKIGLDGLRRAR